MHSYMAHNGMLATVYFRMREEKVQLAQLVDSLPGGREAALEEAAGRQAQLEAQEAVADGSTPLGTPRFLTPMPDTPGTPGGTTPSINGTPEPNDLRRRIPATRPQRKKFLPATDALPKPDPDLPHGTSLEPSHIISPHDAKTPSALAWSSNERIATLARNIDAMEDELRSNGAKGLTWPQNVTYAHFLDYFFIPTLVYELEYPRTNT